MLNIEYLFLRPGRARKGGIDGLHTPIILVGGETANERFICLETDVARPVGGDARKDIVAARLAADTQIIGQLLALGIAARRPAK